MAIGYDMRASSPTLAAAFADGVTAQGLDVVRIGLASTDQLYFASGLLDCPGAMFTASHNPAAYNGIKLCRAGAKPVGKDTGLSVISDEVIAGVPAYDGPAGALSDRD
ncbi:phosphomannomutase/phosphoglucomutase, partial [Agromyces sp. NPDC055657]